MGNEIQYCVINIEKLINWRVYWNCLFLFFTVFDCPRKWKVIEIDLNSQQHENILWGSHFIRPVRYYIFTCNFLPFWKNSCSSTILFSPGVYLVHVEHLVCMFVKCHNKYKLNIFFWPLYLHLLRLATYAVYCGLFGLSVLFSLFFIQVLGVDWLRVRGGNEEKDCQIFSFQFTLIFIQYCQITSFTYVTRILSHMLCMFFFYFL